MKFTPIILSAVLILPVVFTQTALADNHKGDKFAQADTNKDGLLSRPELEKKHQQRLDKLFLTADSNGDGLISKEEIRTHRKMVKQQKPPQNQNR